MDRNSNTDQILRTIKETKQILGVGNTVIWERMKDGGLDVIRLGPRSTRVTLESIQRLIDAGAELPAGKSPRTEPPEPLAADESQ